MRYSELNNLETDKDILKKIYDEKMKRLKISVTRYNYVGCSFRGYDDWKLASSDDEYAERTVELTWDFDDFYDFIFENGGFESDYENDDEELSEKDVERLVFDKFEEYQNEIQRLFERGELDE